MNERVQELAEQADLYARSDNSSMMFEIFQKRYTEKLAELIAAECAEHFTKVWYEQGLDIRGAELGKFMKRFNEHFGVKE